MGDHTPSPVCVKISTLPEEWACPACTLLNPKARSKCNACNHAPRTGKVAKSLPVASSATTTEKKAIPATTIEKKTIPAATIEKKTIPVANVSKTTKQVPLLDPLP